jgi:adenosylhomocysteinase
MDMSFSVQALSIHHLANHAQDLAPGLHPLPADIDEAIARTRLELLGMRLEVASPEQEAYVRSWR